MGLDPRLQEVRRHRKIGRLFRDAIEFETREPGAEHGLAEFGPQAATCIRPTFAYADVIAGGLKSDCCRNISRCPEVVICIFREAMGIEFELS